MGRGISLPPRGRATTMAVSDAITHYRQIRQLTRDELCHLMSIFGYDISTAYLKALEERTRQATVDDLAAIAFALDVSPAVLLSHIPVDMPFPEGPFATGLPDDVDAAEVRDWVAGRATLSHADRVVWWKDRVQALGIRAAHYDEQLQAAHEDADELGEIRYIEARAPFVELLEDRIRDLEERSTQCDLALAHAHHHLEVLLQDM